MINKTIWGKTQTNSVWARFCLAWTMSSNKKWQIKYNTFKDSGDILGYIGNYKSTTGYRYHDYRQVDVFYFFLEVVFSFLFYKLKRTGGEEELQIVQNGCDVLDLLSYSCFCPFHKLVFLTLLLWKKK